MEPNADPDYATAESASLRHFRGLIAEAHGGMFNVDAHAGHHWILKPEEQMRLMDVPSRHRTGIQFVPDCDWSIVAVLRSHLTSLRIMCTALSLPLPGFLQETEEGTSMGTVHRFVVALPPGPLVDFVSAARRYSTDIYLAREDAAVATIRKIMNETGYIIYDFNYVRAERLEMTISSLAERNNRLRDRVHELTRLFRNNNEEDVQPGDSA
ncbi:hypothetical protein PIB30_058527 [Stylosanthes scabra]|uniref:Uncharacterized protein n=1 Tax=Stylosanthes scabra TaxID=79078 RepID=A0ABU6ZIQ9_9FABA|nr:hypothetical protein [Stylosanthes scabra]